MKHLVPSLLLLLFLGSLSTVNAQQVGAQQLLTLDRIYSGEFRQEWQRPIQWIEDGNAYIIIEQKEAKDELIRYDSKTQEKTTFLAAEKLMANGKALRIESFSLSPDATKVLIFTNSSRVWRSNTQGDYWVYDFSSDQLKQLGQQFEASSLMFAKFSANNQYVAYVHKFNLYQEDFQSGTVTQLTFDGSRTIINGTFDWAYEEEFGKRDGFAWSPDAAHIAFWQLDASEIGTFYMINNTDSIYSKPIPIQYPKVGQAPSAAKLGLVDMVTKKITWIPLPGGEKENYIPGMQWVNSDLLLIQQMNRKQNQLIVWSYKPSNNALKQVYVEKEDTWVDLAYPDVSASGWGNNDLPLINNKEDFLRMTENDGWRHVYKINIASGQKTLLTPGDYDVASMYGPSKQLLYFIASPTNSTQRYLYSVDLKGKGKVKRLTPESYEGINTYNVAPNGQFAFHNHRSTQTVPTVRFISLPDHKIIKSLVTNTAYKKKLATLALPEVRFQSVKIEDGLEVDARMVLPIDFDENKKYPVLFHVYGEPWGQVALDEPISLWNVMLAQKGYVIIDMDNRGTPCLKGSAWRKSIYRKVGLINADDQASAAKEILKLPYLDETRTAVWGWSGGGSMTLNLMFRYPEIYQTGISIAPVSDQLIYDNIYQERYMGLPQENKEDFIKGSPITYAKNLQGNLLLIHGTADDNVHYQSAELVVNELIKHNKQFQFMAYPNRSHGIYEGQNTRRHLYTLMTNYLMEHTPVNE
ncbi:MAG: DPP IV N-terminal domain-containing protein [Flammeovirgaceae bacterium]